MIDISQKIKALRLEKELKQKDVAKAINIATNTLSQFENNKGRPSLEVLTLLANFFEVSVDYLLGIEDDFIKPEVQTTLSYREQKLLKAFNLLEDDEKDKIIEDCEYFANKHIKTNQQRRA